MGFFACRAAKKATNEFTMTNHLSTLRHMNRHVEGVCRCWLWIQLAVSVTSPVPPTCRRTEEMWRKAGLLRPEEQRASSMEESYSGHSVMTEESAGTAACSEEGDRKSVV